MSQISSLVIARESGRSSKRQSFKYSRSRCLLDARFRGHDDSEFYISIGSLITDL